jgi:hypothetical protein
MKTKSWAAVSMGLMMFLLTGEYSSAGVAHKNQKKGEAILLERCRAYPENCICEVGTLPRIFIAHTGLKYQQCVPIGCGRGQVLIEGKSAGGRPEFACRPVKDVPYSEPKPLPPVKSSGKRGVR